MIYRWVTFPLEEKGSLTELLRSVQRRSQWYVKSDRHCKVEIAHMPDIHDTIYAKNMEENGDMSMALIVHGEAGLTDRTRICLIAILMMLYWNQ